MGSHVPCTPFDEARNGGRVAVRHGERVAGCTALQGDIWLAKSDSFTRCSCKERGDLPFTKLPGFTDQLKRLCFADIQANIMIICCSFV